MVESSKARDGSEGRKVDRAAVSPLYKVFNVPFIIHEFRIWALDFPKKGCHSRLSSFICSEIFDLDGSDAPLQAGT